MPGPWNSCKFAPRITSKQRKIVENQYPEPMKSTFAKIDAHKNVEVSQFSTANDPVHLPNAPIPVPNVPTSVPDAHTDGSDP